MGAVLCSLKFSSVSEWRWFVWNSAYHTDCLAWFGSQQQQQSSWWSFMEVVRKNEWRQLLLLTICELAGKSHARSSVYSVESVHRQCTRVIIDGWIPSLWKERKNKLKLSINTKLCEVGADWSQVWGLSSRLKRPMPLLKDGRRLAIKTPLSQTLRKLKRWIKLCFKTSDSLSKVSFVPTWTITFWTWRYFKRTPGSFSVMLGDNGTLEAVYHGCSRMDIPDDEVTVDDKRCKSWST